MNRNYLRLGHFTKLNKTLLLTLGILYHILNLSSVCHFLSMKLMGTNIFDMKSFADMFQ